MQKHGPTAYASSLLRMLYTVCWRIAQPSDGLSFGAIAHHSQRMRPLPPLMC